jgi:hypothetical protein
MTRNLLILAFLTALIWWVKPPLILRIAGFLKRVTGFLFAHRWIPPALLFLLSLLLHIGLAFWVKMPLPTIHDEFAYVLSADTFASGRLTNPTPLAWESFQTFHTLFQPTYAAKYPSGQGISLAVGQILFRLPIAGAWLTLSLGTVALYWALRGMLSRQWAFFGGLLTLLNPSVVGWGQSYWGGEVAMLGGAIVLGSLLRLIRGLHRYPANRLMCLSLFFGWGTVLLLNSRLFEGGLFLGTMGMVGLAMRWKDILSPTRAMQWRACGIGVAIPLILGILWFCLYNTAVTQKPFQIPYAVYTKQYDPLPVFLGQPSDPLPSYDIARMRTFYQSYLVRLEERNRNWKSYIKEKKLPSLLNISLNNRLLQFGFIAVGASFLLFRGLVLVKWLFVASLLFVAGASLVIFDSGPHYSAPGYALLLLICLMGLRWLSTLALSRWGWKKLGRPLRLLPVILLPLALVDAAQSLRITVEEKAKQREDFPMARQRLIDTYTTQEGQYLMLVRYHPDYTFHHEWVANGANLPTQKVLWAHLLDDSRNRRLLEAYPTHTPLLVDVTDDVTPPTVQPYPPSPSAQRAGEVESVSDVSSAVETGKMAGK